MPRKSTIILCFVILWMAFQAPAAHAVFFWGTKSLGMGTATVGIADDNNAMEINPAGIAQGDKYSIDLNYERREYAIWDYRHLHPEIEEDDGNEFFGGGEFFEDEQDAIDKDDKNIIDTWRVSVVDSATLPSFAMGFYFTGLNFPASTFQEGEGYQFGLTMAGNFADLVFLGLNGKFMQLTPDENMFNMDAGFLLKILGFMGVGVAGHNVFGADEVNRVNRDITIGVAGFVLEYAQIDFDVTKDFDSPATNTWNFALGAQGIVLGGLTLRGGFRWDQVDDADTYGLGIGWTDVKHGSLGYSFQGDVNNIKNFIHSINLNVIF